MHGARCYNYIMDRDELKKIRVDKLHWTREKLGERVGKDQATIWRYENGELAVPLAVAEVVRMLEARET